MSEGARACVQSVSVTTALAVAIGLASGSRQGSHARDSTYKSASTDSTHCLLIQPDVSSAEGFKQHLVDVAIDQAFEQDPPPFR